MSGNSKPIEQEQDWINLIKCSYDGVDTVYIDAEHNINMREEIVGYDALAVCGGDGTLNSAINAVKNTALDLIYIPTGTLNDTAKGLCLAKKLNAENKRIRRVDMGCVNDTMFAYVLAGGTFTPIGYRTQIRRKKRFKFLAYLLEVFKEYKIHHIKAKIEINGKIYQDEYTLIMAINNSRCFGFRFNKLFSHNDGKGQLLLIKAPKGDGLWAKIKIFFPLFRVFFMKMRRERDGKIIKFCSFKDVKLSFVESQNFTIDGEKIELKGDAEIKILKRKLNLVVF
jgi:diacylglycerol kinase (ATP)